MTLLRRPGVALATLLFLLMGAAFLTQVVPYRQILESQRRVNVARLELATLEQQNAKLQERVEALSTPQEIERLAREKLGYVRPGEIGYVVLDPPQTEESQPAPPPIEIPEEKTWVERLWDFLTGADLES
ncbi:MAG: septum formation initiator family protein [Acidimicrobiia bacterium]